MILVFLLVLFLLLVTVIILSTISIKIEKLELSNYDKTKKLQYNFEVYFELLFLNKLKLLSIKMNKEKIKRMNVKQKIQNVDFKKMKNDISKKEMLEIIKKLDLKIHNLKLKLEIGTEDVIITSAIIAVLGSALGIIFSKFIKEYKEEQYQYEILPIYQNRNLIKLWLNCIIKVKLVHIIFIIYVLLKKRRVEKHERTSNRRAYDYSYE